MKVTGGGVSDAVLEYAWEGGFVSSSDSRRREVVLLVCALAGGAAEVGVLIEAIDSRVKGYSVPVRK